MKSNLFATTETAAQKSFHTFKPIYTQIILG